MGIPLKDDLLREWGSNFTTRITDSGGDYAVSAAQALECTNAFSAYQTAQTNLANARAAGSRSEVMTELRNQSKSNFLAIARSLYGMIQSNREVSNDLKIAAGVHVPDRQPTPIPVPATRPAVAVKSITGRTVRYTIRESSDATSRRKPPGAVGANVFSFVGETPPLDASGYKFEGNATRDVFEVTVPPSTEGATVWVVACWYTERGETSIPSLPIGANIAAGTGLPVGLRIAA